MTNGKNELKKLLKEIEQEINKTNLSQKTPYLINVVLPQAIQPLEYKENFQELPEIPSDKKLIAKDWNIGIDNIKDIDSRLIKIFQLWVEITNIIRIIKNEYLTFFNTD